jgi:hypothetical protein
LIILNGRLAAHQGTIHVFVIGLMIEAEPRLGTSSWGWLGRTTCEHSSFMIVIKAAHTHCSFQSFYLALEKRNPLGCALRFLLQ